tara:strand:+ start:1737 stop:1994 length:258 start_codon:yes stop_codon:yes gene_type:complete
MEAIIANFRVGRHTKYTNHMILHLPSVENREGAEKLLKKHVTWKSPAGKEIKGEVVSAHGNKGAVRVIFETGMPGQAIGAKVEVQ